MQELFYLSQALGTLGSCGQSCIGHLRVPGPRVGWSHLVRSHLYASPICGEMGAGVPWFQARLPPVPSLSPAREDPRCLLGPPRAAA